MVESEKSVTAPFPMRRSAAMHIGSGLSSRDGTRFPKNRSFVYSAFSATVLFAISRGRARTELETTEAPVWNSI